MDSELESQIRRLIRQELARKACELDDRTLTKPQAAARLGTSTRTLDRLAGRGAIPFSTVGSKRKYRLSDLDAYLNRTRTAPQPTVDLFSNATPRVVFDGTCAPSNAGTGISPVQQ